MLGLFRLGVFGWGLIAMPVGDPKAEVLEGIPKQSGFIFAVAFVAGLIDEFVISIVNKFVNLGRPDPNVPEPNNSDAAAPKPEDPNPQEPGT